MGGSGEGARDGLIAYTGQMICPTDIGLNAKML